MLKRSKRLNNLIKNNNKGMSLITVIVAVGFVAILVSILLMTTLINYKMRRVSLHAKDAFYSAEQVLDEVSVGLQRDVSFAMGHAYSEVMTKYSADLLTSEEKEALMQTKYYEYLWEALGMPSSTTRYSVAHLESYLKDTTKWHDAASADNGEYGAFFRTGPDKGGVTDGEMITYKDDGLVLKDLTVYYKDPKGFVSIIKTDIRLVYPDFVMSNTDMPDVASYACVTDGTFYANGVTGSTLTITGNTYMGAMDIDKAHVTNKTLESATTDTHVVKYDLRVTDGGYETNENSTLWAGTITDKSGDITLDGTTNVLDDLNIKGKGSKVTLGGVYNGYGNSLTDPYESSAIVVNGTKSVIDLSKMDTLNLAGHAYIGSRQPSTGATDTTAKKVKGAVRTGESIAVKSNQLMYLIPPECLYVDEAGVSQVKSNPVTNEELQLINNKIKGGAKIPPVSDTAVVGKLNSNLSSYVAYKADGTVDYIQDTDATSGLTYYYMAFKDDDAANRYFSKYYNDNQASSDDYIGFYLKEVIEPATTSASYRINLAGNGLKGSKDKGFSNEMGMIAAEGSSYSTFESDYNRSSSIFKSYCTKLASSKEGLTGIYTDSTRSTVKYAEGLTSKPTLGKQSMAGRFKIAKYKDGTEPEEGYGKEVVFANLIDTTDTGLLKRIVDDLGSGNQYRIPGEGEDGDILLYYSPTGTGKVSVATTDNLVIAYGDVEIPSGFKGAVYCSGDVEMTVNGTATLEANPEAVESLLKYTVTLGTDEVQIAGIFKDNDGVIYSIVGADGEMSDDISLANLVIYENWSKE